MMTNDEIERPSSNEARAITALHKYFFVEEPTSDSIKFQNGKISTLGSVTVQSRILVMKTLPCEFESVGGNFMCHNVQMETLQGSPSVVHKDFTCSDNHLESLLGGPVKVGGNYHCVRNQLTSLEGCPQSVFAFNCSDNKLTSLQHAPQKVEKYFYCAENELQSLIGALQTLASYFDCSLNNLTNLIGSPIYVGKSFAANQNPLESLHGIPKYIGGELWLSYSKHLPLLPILKVKGCKKILFNSGSSEDTNKDLSAILNRYLGTGTRGMLPCAMEMIKAGYGSNAQL